MRHNLYIFLVCLAIESVNFCPAAGIVSTHLLLYSFQRVTNLNNFKQAWNAMWSNALQVATINGIGDFILFLGKVIFEPFSLTC